MYVDNVNNKQSSSIQQQQGCPSVWVARAASAAGPVQCFWHGSSRLPRAAAYRRESGPLFLAVAPLFKANKN